MSHIPTEIITNILSRLPAKSLIRFRCVSKPWCSLIKDPSFIKLHLHHAHPYLMFRYSNSDLFSVNPNNPDSTFHEAKQIDYPYKTPSFVLDILGSCNGLLLIRPDQHIYCIWNPTTQEFHKLPQAPIQGEHRARCINYGFGYDDSCHDYKVVKIVTFYNSTSQVKVYTLGSNSWTRVDDVPYKIHYSGFPGVLVYRCLHWLAKLNSSQILISFDLADHRFKLVPLPDYEERYFCMNVGVSRGCLCILSFFYHPVRLELWVMMDYGVKESWTMLYSFTDPVTINSFRYFNPSCKFLLENKDVVVCDKNSGKHFSLVREWYEPRIYVNTLVSLFNLRPTATRPPRCFESEIYVQSLVSLNTATYMWEQQPRCRRKNNMRDEES